MERITGGERGIGIVIGTRWKETEGIGCAGDRCQEIVSKGVDHIGSGERKRWLPRAIRNGKTPEKGRKRQRTETDGNGEKVDVAEECFFL